jgi:hypothetical protein
VNFLVVNSSKTSLILKDTILVRDPKICIVISIFLMSESLSTCLVVSFQSNKIWEVVPAGCIYYIGMNVKRKLKNVSFPSPMFSLYLK